MRTVRAVGRFDRDFRRELSGVHGKKLEKLVNEATAMLADDKPLPRRYRDHALSGAWTDHRDCHLRSDLVLIYRKPGEDSLELVRLGSHSELFG